MTQTTQLEQLQQENANLKVRCFDLGEALNSERNNIGQFAGAIAELLQLPKEKQTDLNEYVSAIQALVAGDEAESKPEGE